IRVYESKTGRSRYGNSQERTVSPNKCLNGRDAAAVNELRFEQKITVQMCATECATIGTHLCDGVLEKPQTYCCIAVWRGDIRPEKKICRRARVHSCGVVLACIKGNGDVVDVSFVIGRAGC